MCHSVSEGRESCMLMLHRRANSKHLEQTGRYESGSKQVRMIMSIIEDDRDVRA